MDPGNIELYQTLSSEHDAKFEKNRLAHQSDGRIKPLISTSISKKTNTDVGMSTEKKMKNAMPVCLKIVLAKAKHNNPEVRFQDNALNNRFMSTMFMPKIDTEAVEAATTDLDLDEYASTVSMDKENELRRLAKAAQAEVDRKHQEEEMEIDCHGHDWKVVKNRPKERKPYRKKELRANPAHVFPSSTSLPYLLQQSGSIKTTSIVGTIGTSGSAETHMGMSMAIGEQDMDDAVTIDSIARTRQIQENRTSMTLPSVHDGTSLTVPVNKVDRYFGKDARSGFFNHYREMFNSNLAFAHVKMTRNEEEQWVNTAVNPDDLECENFDNEEQPEEEEKGCPEGNRSGWDSRLNEGGDNIGILKTPHHEGRVISPSFKVSIPRGSPLGSPAITPRTIQRSISPYNNLLECESSIERLDKTSLWTADASMFKKGQGDMDTMLLSGTPHSHFDAKKKINNQQLNSFMEGATSLQDTMYELHLPSITSASVITGTVNDTADNVGDISPRTKFIAACIDRGLAPLPSLVMRKSFNSIINLSHFGIGDKMGCAFAECLVTLPVIESINLCDNNLTDESLYPLITACSRIKGLQELNLSRNKIDERASKALAAYLSSPDCPLYRLVLDASDVDDGECASFVECLETNQGLHELDMSNNLLGNAESIPGARTGGVALADFLTTKGCKLTYLKLAWNGIRQKTANYFASALGKNKTLTYIDLSYNGLGSEAGEILGDSILDNRTLKTIILDNNNLGSTACVTICIGICQNQAIKRISLDENPIGEAGAKMIMQVPMLIGNRVELTARNCNTVMRDDRCWFDLASPCRSYSLDMSLPFERAVAFSLLQVVASHSSYIIAKSSFQEDRTNYDVRKGTSVVKKFGPKEDIIFAQGLANDKEDFFDEEQHAVVDGLRTILAAASDHKKGQVLFEEADIDGGGDLDREELGIVIERLGLASEPDKVAEIFALFDLDGTGVMTKEEFLDMLKAQSREAAARVKEMTTYPMMCLKEDVKKHKKYIPPRFGMLNLTVVDGFEEKESFSVLTSTDQNNALLMAIKMGDSQLINEAVRTSKIRYSEGVSLFKRLYKESGNFAASVARLLPQMKTNAEARQLVSKVTGEDRNKVAQIKQILGPASKTIFGMCNGFYQLDLSKEYDRICLSRLFEQSSRFNTKRAMACWCGYGRIGDTSQHGNWTSFRNEFLNKNPIEITPERFTPMPQSGILEFDFSGVLGPSVDEKHLPDTRLLNVMSNLYLLKNEEEKAAAANLLARFQRNITFSKVLMPGSTRRQQENALRKEGGRSTYECPRQKSLEQGIAGDEFYDNLLERRNELKDYAQQEVISVNFAPGEVTADDLLPTPSSTATTSPISSAPASPIVGGKKSLSPVSPIPIPKTIHEVETVQAVNMETGTGHKEDDLSIASLELPEVQSSQSGIQALRARLEALIDGPMSHKISKAAKAIRFCEVIEETFSSIWLDCRQVALILSKIPFVDQLQSVHFGSYTVHCAVALFGRIVDPHNIELVIKTFSARDAACFWNRIGFLNLFNPAKPEGTIELNFARREEAIVARILIYLSLVEPGNNLPQPKFQWKRDMDPTPGFEVTAPWATIAGLPQKGNFGVTFYSGEGEEKEGCKANKIARRALMQFVLCDENKFDKDPLMDDDDHTIDLDAPEKSNNSAINFLKNENAYKMWNTYIWPNCLEDKPTSKKRG